MWRLSSGLLALLSIACGSSWQRVATEPPISEIAVSDDGKEAHVRLIEGASIGECVDLRIFGAFRPGLSGAEARALFGPATRVEHKDGDVQYIYETGSGAIVIAEFEELSSTDGARIPRTDLRAVPRDPSYWKRLPPSLLAAFARFPELRTVAIVSTKRDDPVVGFRLQGGTIEWLSMAKRDAG